MKRLRSPRVKRVLRRVAGGVGRVRGEFGAFNEAAVVAVSEDESRERWTAPRENNPVGGGRGARILNHLVKRRLARETLARRRRRGVRHEILKRRRVVVRDGVGEGVLRADAEGLVVVRRKGDEEGLVRLNNFIIRDRDGQSLRCAAVTGDCKRGDIRVVGRGRVNITAAGCLCNRNRYRAVADDRPVRQSKTNSGVGVLARAPCRRRKGQDRLRPNHNISVGNVEIGGDKAVHRREGVIKRDGLVIIVRVRHINRRRRRDHAAGVRREGQVGRVRRAAVREGDALIRGNLNRRRQCAGHGKVLARRRTACVTGVRRARHRQSRRVLILNRHRPRRSRADRVIRAGSKRDDNRLVRLNNRIVHQRNLNIARRHAGGNRLRPRAEIARDVRRGRAI